MPWRRTQDAYAVWVSEIMLQQTRVETVIPYYLRFLRLFPDIHALAQADEQAVLKAWEGLGYYRRARHLHAAAREVVRCFSGNVPTRAADLLALPGIGAYTAAAIASICGGEPAPVLDGNVARVLARFLCLRTDAGASAARHAMGAFLEAHISHRHPGDFNQAMMELGAMVCKPGAPDCANCPLRAGCKGLAQGVAAKLPVRKTQRATPRLTVAAGLLVQRGRVLLVQRDAGKLLGGLWEVPGGRRNGRESLADTVRRTVLSDTGRDVRVGRKLCVVAHAYSHFSITLHAFLCEESGAQKLRARQRSAWVPLDDLSLHPCGRATLRVLDAAGKKEGP
jgi:A/G-specific adenine glycosylase